MCRRPCGCSSHARMRGKGKAPAARATGPRCRGGYPVFACPIDRRLRLCARVGTQHLLVVVRRRSCVVASAWSSAALLPAAVLCERARCARRAGWRARAWCCPVAAAAIGCTKKKKSRWSVGCEYDMRYPDTGRWQGPCLEDGEVEKRMRSAGATRPHHHTHVTWRTADAT